MEFEKYYTSTPKEAFRNLRKNIIEGAKYGGDAQRARLLAYAFLRGREYSSIEQTTEAKNLCSNGKQTYYSGLAFRTALALHTAFGQSDTKYFQDPSFKVIKEAMFEWMKDHYVEKQVVESIVEEAAHDVG